MEVDVRCVLSVCLLILANTYQTFGSINFYLSEEEVSKLFGIPDAQLFYIRDGVVNANAMRFKAHVQPDQDLLTYHWQSTTSDIVVLYDVQIDSIQATGEGECYEGQNNCEIMKSPQLSVANSGQLPKSAQSFTVSVDCSHQASGEVNISMRFAFSIVDGPREVVLQIERLKKCKKDPSLYSKPSLSTNNYKNLNTPATEIPLQTEQSTLAFYLSIIVVAIVIIVIIIGVTLWYSKMNEHQQATAIRSDNSRKLQMSSPHLVQYLRPDLPNNAQKAPSHSSVLQFTPFINDLRADITEIRNKLSDITMQRSQINLGDLLHKGQFARIYKGTIKDGSPMLIKTVTDAATEEQRRLLLLESSLLKGINHSYVLSMRSVVLDPTSDPPLVLFPFTQAGGYLKHYLQRVRMDSPAHIYPALNRRFENATTQDLVGMATQIACGMTHLSQKGIVHKDLATRNCMIDSEHNIKITDNALARDAFPSDYCCLGDNENRPVRWLALESLIHKVYSSASDVWSFGVLLWELQSLADQPYSDIDGFEVEKYLSDGFRLSQPQNCPDNLYNIIASCWHYSPDQRPHFNQLLQMLYDFNAELCDYV